MIINDTGGKCATSYTTYSSRGSIWDIGMPNWMIICGSSFLPCGVNGGLGSWGAKVHSAGVILII